MNTINSKKCLVTNNIVRVSLASSDFFILFFYCVDVEIRNSHFITPHPLAETETPPHSNCHLNQFQTKNNIRTILITISLFYTIVCSTLSCCARLRRARRSLKRCIHHTSHINRNIAHNPKTQSKMLTLHQFLAYCQRNNIQTIVYFKMVSYMTDADYETIHFSHLFMRGENTNESPYDYSFEARLSPRAFYEWYAANYDVANITHAVKRYMRANCPLRSFFLNELPF